MPQEVRPLWISRIGSYSHLIQLMSACVCMRGGGIREKVCMRQYLVPQCTCATGAPNAPMPPMPQCPNAPMPQCPNAPMLNAQLSYLYTLDMMLALVGFVVSVVDIH